MYSLVTRSVVNCGRDDHHFVRSKLSIRNRKNQTEKAGEIVMKCQSLQFKVWTL